MATVVCTGSRQCLLVSSFFVSVFVCLPLSFFSLSFFCLSFYVSWLVILIECLHRFKKPGSKNYQNIYPPSATLHLSNIPSSIEEDDLKKAFDAINLTVQVGNILNINWWRIWFLLFQAFKFFPKDRKMALVQLPTVEESITALVKLHNFQLSETSHLR